MLRLKEYQVHLDNYVLPLFMTTKLCKCVCDFTACFSSDPYVEIFGQVLLPNHSLVDTTVTRLRCMTGRVDCCNTNADTKWYLPSGDATTSGISSYGDSSPRGAIELWVVSALVSTASLNQGIHRCTVLESDPATNPYTISLYVGIYNPGEGECIAHLVTGCKVMIEAKL